MYVLGGHLPLHAHIHTYTHHMHTHRHIYIHTQTSEGYNFTDLQYTFASEIVGYLISAS